MVRRALLGCLFLAGCNGATSGNLLQVPYSIGGAPFADGGPLHIVTETGWDVELDLAKIDVGPFYFNAETPDPTDYRSGVVLVQSLRQVTVNLLDPTLVPVEGGAQGETGNAVAVEIDLLPPDSTITDPDVPGPAGQSFAVLAGTASLGLQDGGTLQVPFKGWVTLSAADANTTTPLSWLQRVNGAACALDFAGSNAQLTLQIDPSSWFDKVDFRQLIPVGGGADGGTEDAGPGPFGWSDPSPFNNALLNQIGLTTNSSGRSAPSYTFTLTGN